MSRGWPLAAIALVVPILAATAAPAAAYPRPGTTELVSIAPDGGPADQPGDSASEAPALSADGRLVIFHSRATNLVPGDTNLQPDVFVRDRPTGEIARVSVATDGTQGEHAAYDAVVTPDGRFVAFNSWSSALWPGDEGWADIFVHDRTTGVTQRVSNPAGGGNGNESSTGPAISADGRWVAFESDAGNLIPGDANGDRDVFIADRRTGTIALVSRSSAGAAADAFATDPAISADGRFIAFSSRATNLVEGDRNATFDVFLHDRETGATTRVSTAVDGGDASEQSYAPRLSADGRFVAFSSLATNLAPADANGTDSDVFVHDRQSGVTRRVSVSSSGVQANGVSILTAFSGDGRYATFWSDADNLVPGDTNGKRDIFLHDLHTGATELMSVAASPGGADDISWGVGSITPGGRYVAFKSLASNLVAGDTNEGADVFVRDRGPALGARILVAERQADGTTRISGEATFSGTQLAAATDPLADPGPGAPPGSDIAGAVLTLRPELEDLHVRIELRDLPHLASVPCVDLCPPAGAPGLLYGLRFSLGSVSYEVRIASAAVTPDGILRAPYAALFRCSAACAEVAQLQAGIGSTAEEVVFALPLSALGSVDRTTLADVEAYSSTGTASTGATGSHDDLTLGSIPIPRERVSLAVAPANTRPEEVPFDESVPLVNGAFAATVPGEAGQAWARVCLAEGCAYASVALAD